MQEVDLQWSKPSLTVLGVLNQSLGYRKEEIRASESLHTSLSHRLCSVNLCCGAELHLESGTVPGLTYTASRPGGSGAETCADLQLRLAWAFWSGKAALGPCASGAVPHHGTGVQTLLWWCSCGPIFMMFYILFVCQCVWKSGDTCEIVLPIHIFLSSAYHTPVSRLKCQPRVYSSS